MTHRVTRQAIHALVDVASEPPAIARVTRQAIHAIVETASEPPAPARVTRHAIYVLAIAPTPLGAISFSVACSVQVELQAAGAPAEEVYVTELEAQALVFAPEGEIGVRVSQVAAETLHQPADTVRVSQLAAEVLHVPQGALCPTYPVVYRLRIAKAAPYYDEDEIVVTSYSTGDSFIVDVPRVDGSTFDPMTGKVTVGAATVLVADPDEGTCLAPDPTVRAITQKLADANANSQLLSRPAYIEISRDGLATAYQPFFAGYVTGMTLVDGITWEIQIANTTRDDETTKVWATSDYPSAYTVSCLVGGPTFETVPSPDVPARRGFEGYWKATVKGIYDTFVHLDIDEDDCGGFPPSEMRKFLETDNGWFSGNDPFQKNVFRWAQSLAQKYFVRGFPSAEAEAEWVSNPTGKPAVRGYMPRLKVHFTEQDGTPISFSKPMMASYVTTNKNTGRETNSNCWESLGNHFYVNWDDAGSDGIVVDDQLSFYIAADDVSELAPMWLYGHPVDLLVDLLEATGATVNLDSSSATPIFDAKNAMGDLRVAMRITKSYTVAEAIAALCGPFGLGVRYEDDGTRTVFCWRTRQSPVATIVLDDLVAPASPWWKNEEQSKLFSIEWKFKRYDVWPGQDQKDEAPDGDRAFDGMMEFEETPIVFQTAATQQAGTRTESYDIPAMLLASTGESLNSLVDVCAVWSDQTFGVYANGGIITEIEVFHELLTGSMPHIGDQVTLNLSARPGFDAYESPVSQRGLPAHCLVIGRTPTESGYKLTLLEMPEDILPPVDVGVPPIATGPYSLDFSLTKGAGSLSSTTVIVSLDDPTGWTGFDFIVEYLVDPPTTPDAGTSGQLWYDRLLPTTPLSMGLFPSGSTIWIRISGFGINAFSPWQSIVLDSGDSNAGGAIVQTPTIQLTMDGSGNVDVTVNAGVECVKVYADADSVSFPSRANILAGSTDTTSPFTFDNIITVNRGEIAYVGAIAEDLRGNKSIAAYAALQRAPAVEESLSVTFSGGISAGDIRDIQVPYDCEVLSWTVLALVSGSIVVDVWTDTLANYPPTVADSITGTGKPTITSATNATGNVSLWSDTTLAKDDIVRFYVDSVSTFTQVTVSLTVRRT